MTATSGRSERQLICGLAKYNNDIVTLLNPSSSAPAAGKSGDGPGLG